jgi:hypothetical protein
MKRSLRGVLARVERISVAVRQRAERLDPAELIAILRSRFTGRRDHQPLSDEEARERGRKLRQMMQAAGALP